MLKKMDKIFYKKLIKIGLPIVIQQFLISSMQFVDNLMIGSLGETRVVGVGNANQIGFFVFILMFGFTSTAGVFASQYFGKKDFAGIKKTLGICLISTFVIGFSFFLTTIISPLSLLGIFNKNPDVLMYGSQYIRIVSISYVFLGISISFSSVLKGSELTKIPMITSLIAMSVNALLNYVLIFGKLGFPAMGVRGAAIGTVIAMCLEMVLLISIAKARKTPAAGKIKEIFSIDKAFAKSFYKIGTPVFINETLWALGSMTYIYLFNRLGIESAAAMIIFTVIERLVFGLFIAIAHASSIMVGNQIGAGKIKEAYRYGKKSLILTLICALVVGGLLILIRPSVISLYNISDMAKQTLNYVLLIFGCMMWMPVFNFTSIVGVLRSGGDTRYAMFIDIIGMWFISIPIAFVAGLIFKLETYIVYLLIVTVGEVFKFIISLLRFRSKKWINDVTVSADIYKVQI